MKKQAGFTLLEILLVVAAIAILAGIVIIAINPGKQLATVRNTSRRSDVSAIVNAVYQYALDNSGSFPNGINTTLRMVGTGSGCNISCGVGTITTNTGGSAGGTSTVVDSSQTNFDAGTYLSTIFDSTNSILKLSASSTSGTYLSSIKDATNPSATWTTLAYTTNRPTNKELPNSPITENIYGAGNANMSGNVLLMHFNESSGATTFADTSGNNNNGSCIGTACPTEVSGKLNGAVSLDGNLQYINAGRASSLNFGSGSFSFAFWMKPNTGNNSQILIGKGENGNSGFRINTEYRYGVQNQIAMSVNSMSANGNFSVRGTASSYKVGQWNYVVGVWDKASSLIRLYLDSVDTNAVYLGGIGTEAQITNTDYPNRDLLIGAYDLGAPGTLHFNGQLDEVSIFNRALTPVEISDMFKRGVTRLKLQVRSCLDNTCSANPGFIGPDGSATTYFTDGIASTNAAPSFSLSNLSGRFLQYKAYLDSDSNVATPELKSTSLTYSTPGTLGTATTTITGGETTDPVCLDLTSLLTPSYITSLPFDPAIGSAVKTYYAIKKTAGGRITVEACNVENAEFINVTK